MFMAGADIPNLQKMSKAGMSARGDRSFEFVSVAFARILSARHPPSFAARVRFGGPMIDARFHRRLLCSSRLPFPSSAIILPAAPFTSVALIGARYVLCCAVGVGDRAAALKSLKEGHDLLNAMEKGSKPVVAAVHGDALVRVLRFGLFVLLIYFFYFFRFVVRRSKRNCLPPVDPFR